MVAGAEPLAAGTHVALTGSASPSDAGQRCDEDRSAALQRTAHAHHMDLCDLAHFVSCALRIVEQVSVCHAFNLVGFVARSEAREASDTNSLRTRYGIDERHHQAAG